MKRYAYYACFGLLGFLVTLLMHAVVEIFLLKLVILNTDTYGQSYWWQHWEVIHSTASLGLALGGIFVGTLLGRHFWQILYIEERYGKPRF